MLIFETFTKYYYNKIGTNIREVVKVSKAFRNPLKHIDKLPHTQKEQAYQWGKRYVQPSTSIGGRLINKIG
jgi:hypothetical protein